MIDNFQTNLIKLEQYFLLKNNKIIKVEELKGETFFKCTLISNTLHNKLKYNCISGRLYGISRTHGLDEEEYSIHMKITKEENPEYFL